jgi:hypothetical protein
MDVGWLWLPADPCFFCWDGFFCVLFSAAPGFPLCLVFCCAWAWREKLYKSVGMWCNLTEYEYGMR